VHKASAPTVSSAAEALFGPTLLFRSDKILTMEPSELLQAADREGHRLLAVAAVNWQRPVPHCPAWDAAELVRHTGGILSWMSAVVESTQRISRRALDPAPQPS
jgi:Mycothiol maleylpyruvate isomerase N-terminal domain